jgi:exonuclease SbcC
VGEANQRVQSALNMRTTRERVAGELAAAKKQQAIFEELRVAFSKNGVPAMIIESVLPELEFAANALLSRMTNGRMNVRFETQRLTQRGETSETLEIRISDELGERAYEMFSGGEAFRVNFAIRIALSRLLAHRANARLQTLFVDEGFGTQDAQGRERLIEAIKAIEDDFERIFVITHIDELKDAFPAQIEVRKTARGSIARVV